MDGVSASFLRKLKWFVLAETLYSDDDSHGDALYVLLFTHFKVSNVHTRTNFLEHRYESWKILRKLFVGRLDADKMKELIVKRGTSRVTGTTWTFQDKIETYTRKDMETLSSEELENILVDDLIDHLERPHQDVVESFTNYVVSACDKVDRGESDHATTGLVRARELKAIFQGQQNETPPPHDVSKLIESAKFNAEHMVTFLMNADMKDEPNRKIRYGKVVTIADPIRGYFVSYAIASGFIIMGDLNAVAPLISMFFMMTYGMINYACFYSSISRSPGWRPTFKYFSPWVSLVGSILCIVCMFLTICTHTHSYPFLLCVCVSQGKTDWGPTTDAVFFRARSNLYETSKNQCSSRNVSELSCSDSWSENSEEDRRRCVLCTHFVRVRTCYLGSRS